MMKSKSKLLDMITNHINVVLTCLIIAAIVDIASAGIYISVGASAFLYSVFPAFWFTLYAISNVTGAKHGHLFNCHILRWSWLKAHDKESEYQTICKKYAIVMFPISLIWALVNLILAFCKVL